MLARVLAGFLEAQLLYKTGIAVDPAVQGTVYRIVEAEASPSFIQQYGSKVTLVPLYPDPLLTDNLPIR